MVRAFRPAALALVVLAALGAASCGDDDGYETPPATTAVATVTAAQLADATAALCEAEALAKGGDLAAAEAAFFDGAHQFIHELAATIEREGSAPASALLIAKARTEAAFSENRADAAETLAQLRAETERAARDIGMEAPPCDGGG